MSGDILRAFASHRHIMMVFDGLFVLARGGAARDTVRDAGRRRRTLRRGGANMRRRIAWVVLVGVAAFASATAGAARGGRQPSKADIEKVTEAAPNRPTVRPAKQRKLLVYGACRAFRHKSIPLASRTMEILGEKSGAFQAVVTDDPSAFEAENLRKFDAICMNNTTGDALLPADFKKLSKEEKEAAREREGKLRKNLLQFVKDGKGIVGIHAATDCYKGWPEYGKMMGGYFDGHPWGSRDTVTIKLDEPDHPLNAAFGGQGFTIKEEIYQIKAPYSREALRVLLSIDTDKTAKKKRGIKRKDGDFAVSWIRDYGKGRVFYCSLGHNNHVFWDKAVLKHYLDGIQFAMGDLKADATPSAKLGR